MMTPDQRFEALEKANARLMGVIAAQTAVIVSLVSTHRDRLALGALIEVASQLSINAAKKQNLPPEHVDAFLQVIEGMQAAAMGAESVNVREAREALRSILKNAGGRPG